VGVDFGEGDLIEGAGEADEGGEGSELGCGGVLDFEVAEEADAEVVFVVVFDVGALVGERAGLPDAAGAVDDEVVGDVGPMAVGGFLAGVEFTDVFEFVGSGVPGVGGGFPGGVVDGDSRDAVHGADVGEVGADEGPVGAGDEDDGRGGGGERVAVGVGEEGGAEVGAGGGDSGSSGIGSSSGSRGGFGGGCGGCGFGGGGWREGLFLGARFGLGLAA